MTANRHSRTHEPEWTLTDPTGGDPFMGGPVNIRVCAVCGREPRAAEREALRPVPQPERAEGLRLLGFTSSVPVAAEPPRRRRLSTRTATRHGFHGVVIVTAVVFGALRLASALGGGAGWLDALQGTFLAAVIVAEAITVRRLLRERG